MRVDRRLDPRLRPPRQMWQIRASASAASAGFGASVRQSNLVTIGVTWALSARPLPVTDALTSLGVCSTTGMPVRGRSDHRDAAHLRDARHGADVVLAEDALDRDDVRPVRQDARVDLLLELVQPPRRVEAWRGAEDSDVHHGQRSADGAVDHTDATSGESGSIPSTLIGPARR